MQEYTIGRFIDPFTDFGFKRLFGSEPHKELLIDFLNQLFLGERHIVDLVYSKNEHVGQLLEDRRAIFDLFCTGLDGEQFIIEVQRLRQQYFKDRCVYYTSSLIREQTPAGVHRWDYRLKPVYLIGLMDFTFEDSLPDQYLHKIQLTRLGTGEVFYDKLGYTFIEMPKFSKTESELVTELDNWFFLLKNLSKLDKIPVFLRKPVFSKLFNIAEVCKLNKAEKMAYDASLKYKWDWANSLDYIQKEGFEKGVQEGMEKGIEQGIAEGKLEEKMTVARSMKKKGLSNSLIAELLELSVDEVERLEA
ncbi:Rpn family recombination-promoting nuclease/putative transposase [Dyadobacter pollutisoli]|uniref:Rpn family recombination-promoting nuclease/putative transposase n=1 Tax=Dyadobacter pollutisoli TaxID=2910158 RepID=A0A9E8SPE5_9BACT|nr:Rpn family recombination-promoting nuclease/putative transposase [Dyadobacter pollutisoli]WAC15284.1 Rpn family recombination-promoting nuclease/putative transposase [Dyadobacter pollutisoli]